MFSDMTVLTGLATACASVITILSLAVLLVKGARWFISLPEQVRVYFFYRPKYILIPTAEETARYCEKAFESKKITYDEIMEERSYNYIRYMRKFRTTSASRIVLMGIFFSIIYFIFIVRLAYFGFLTPQRAPEVGDLPPGVLSFYLGFFLLLAPIIMHKFTKDFGRGDESFLRNSIRRFLTW